MGSFSVNPEDFLAEESRRKSAFQVSPEDFLKGEQSPGLMSSLAQPTIGIAQGTISALKSIGGTLELLPKAANIATGHYGVQEDIGRWMREKAGGIEKNMPQGRVTNLEQIKGPRDLLDWTTFNVGNALPSMGVSMAGGVAGGLVAGPTGAAVGAGGMSYLLNAGEVYANLRDQGIDAPKASAIAGIPMAVLDMVVPKMEAGKLVWKLAGQEGAEEAVKTGLKAVAKKTLKEAGTEGLTEAGQEAISDVTEQLSGAPSQPALAHVLRILNAGAAGAVGGAGTSAIVDALPTREKRAQQAAAEDEATTTEILNQPAAEPPVPTPTTASSMPSGGLAVPTGTTPQNTVTGPGNDITETAPAPTSPPIMDQLGAGKNLYQTLWQQLETGNTSLNGKPVPMLQDALALKNEGRINTLEDLQEFSRQYALAQKPEDVQQLVQGFNSGPVLPRRITWRNIDGKQEMGTVTGYDKDGDGLVDVQPDNGKQAIKLDLDQFEPAQDELPAIQGEFITGPDGKRRIALGIKEKETWEVVSSSMYQGNIAPVVVKELLQNAFDAVRGVPGGKVDINVSKDGTITVADTGKGMTEEELGTVFVDLANSGKREEGEASGGFGFAKASYLKNSQQISITTVAREKDGKLYRSGFTATPDQLEKSSGGVDFEHTQVPEGTPTGTTVVAKMTPEQIKQSNWQIDTFLSRTHNSVQTPGAYNPTREQVSEGTYWDTDEAGNRIPEGVNYKKPVKNAFPDREKLGKIATLQMSSAVIDVYKTPTQLTDELTPALRVEVNNNGIFQFEMSVDIGKGKQVKGVPSAVAINIKPLVKEGSTEYPFTASREELRDAVSKTVKDFIYDSLVLPALDKTNNAIANQFRNMPTMGTGIGKVFFYDVGKRLTAEETQKLVKDPNLIRIGETVYSLANRALAALKRANKILSDQHVRLENLGENVGSVGLVLSEHVHGLWIKDPDPVEGKPRRDRILINPFSPIIARFETNYRNYNEETHSYEKVFKEFVSNPDNVASRLWNTIKHEILHDKIGDHYENFTTGEGDLASALGAKFEVGALNALVRAYADERGNFRPGITEALGVYEASRQRNETEKDILGGKAVAVNGTPDQAGRPVVSPGELPIGGESAFRTDQLSDRRVTDRGDYGLTRPEATRALNSIRADQQKSEGTPRAETAIDVPPEAHAVAGVVQLNLDGIGATKGPDGLTTAQANDIARSLKKFGLLQKWSSTLLQWGYRYPALKPLTDYIANIEAWQKRANDIRVEADELITLMQKLGKDRLNKLATMTFTVGELSYRRGRRLTDEEIISIAQKFKIDSDTMQVFQALDVNFLTALRQMQKAMVEEAKWHLANNPTELKARIDQINSDFDKMAERNYFPRSRFGNYNIIFRPSEDVTYERTTFKKGRQVVLAFEEERVRNTEWKKLREALKGKLIDAEEPTRDIFSDEERAFVGFPPALFESFEEKLNLTAEQKTKLKNIALDLSPGISFLKHLKKQKGIAGYSQDLLRVTADYYQHYANHLARIEYRAQLGKNLAEMGEFVNKIKSGDRANARKIQMAMKQHFGYVMNPGNDLPALRGWMYNYFFAFVPKQVLVNLTQVPFFSQQYLAATSGLPPIKADWAASRALTSAAIDITRLFQVDKTKKGRAAIGAVVGAAVSAPFMGPAGIVTGAIEGAGYGLSSRTDLMSGQQLKEYGKKLEADPNFASKSKLSLADVEFLQWGVQMGFLDQSFATELASVARGNVLTRMFPGSSIADKWARKITAVGTAPFSLSEKYNRFVTGLAAFRMAQARGMSQEEAQGFAKEAVQRTMFEYARHNRPRLMQGKKASLFMFMSYLQHATYFAVASPGALRWWLAMLLFAGIKGLPWAEDAMEIFNFAGSFLKSKLGLKNPRVDLEKEIREMAIAIGANPNHALYGWSRDTFGIAPLGQLAGIPIPSLDFWPSIQQGRVLRGLSPTLQALQGQLKPAEYVGQLTQELAGAAGGTGMNMLKATLGAGVDPLSTRVLQIMMPNAIRNLARASRYDKEMKATDNAGNPVVKFAPDSVQQQGEIIGQMLGVQPSRLSNAKDMLWSFKQMERYYLAKREGLYNDFAAARISGDREAMADAKNAWRDYNNTVPPEFRVSASALVQSLKNRMMNRKLAEKGLPLQKDYIRLYRDWQSAFPQE